MFRCTNLWASTIILWISLRISVKNDEFSCIIFAINRRSSDDAGIYRQQKMHAITITYDGGQFKQLRSVITKFTKSPKVIFEFPFFGLIISVFNSASCFYFLPSISFLLLCVRVVFFCIINKYVPRITFNYTSLCKETNNMKHIHSNNVVTDKTKRTGF